MIGDFFRFGNILGRSRTVIFSELALAAFQCEVDLIDIVFDQTFIGSDACIPRLFRGNLFIRIRRTVGFCPFSAAVIHLCRRAAVPEEGVFVDIAPLDRACAPDRARGHDSVRRRFTRDSFAIEDITLIALIDELIIFRFFPFELDAAVGNIVRACIFRVASVSFLFFLIVDLDFIILCVRRRVAVQLCFIRISRDDTIQLQRGICSIALFIRVLDRGFAVIDLVDACLFRQLDRDFFLQDIARERVMGKVKRICFNILIIFGIIPRKGQTAAKSQRTIIADIFPVKRRRK